MESNSTFFLVISDSHGDIANLEAILEWAQSSVCDFTFDAAIFLGDGYADLAQASARTGFPLSWHAVRGNVDYQQTIHTTKELDVPAKNPAKKTSRRLFLSHGNHYRVEEGCQILAAIALSARAEAALFGHLHVPHCANMDGIFLLNPGSISRPRSNAGCTFAVLECPDSGPLAARFFNLENQQCREITLGVREG